MRLIFLLILLPLAHARGQVVGRLYYDDKWLLTKLEAAVYFRVSVIDTTNQVFVGAVKDYTKAGKLIMSGSYLGGKRNGTFINYYSSGRKASEGEYADGVRVGKWVYYHPNEKLRCEALFEAGEPRVLLFNDSTGRPIIQNGTGPWEETYEEPSTGEPMVIRGLINNYQKHGIWTRTAPDGQVWYEMRFIHGEFAEGSIVADSMKVSVIHPMQDILPEDAKHHRVEQFIRGEDVTRSDYPYLREQPSRFDPIYTIVEYSAHPKDGIAGFYNEVARLIRYPPDARRRGIQGRVFVEFIIERDGSLTDVKCIKGVGAGCDEEAVRVIRLTGKWTPGVQGRKRVRQRYTLPIIFRLG